MTPAHRIVSKVLVQIIRPAPLCQEKVEFAWRMSVGPGLGRTTRARIDDRRVLVVTADSVQWRREVERSLGLIRSRLDALLGPDAFINVEIICHG